MTAAPSSAHTLEILNSLSASRNAEGLTRDDTEKLYQVALEFKDGRSDKIDQIEAVWFLRLSAEAGHAGAQYELAFIHILGTWASQDDKEALRWLKEAANQNHTRAQYNLGVFYHEGRGVDKDPAEAVRWWRMAAFQRHDDAQTNLGRMYLKGLGVEQNDAEAAYWFRKAAELNNPSAQYNLGLMHLVGRGCEKNKKDGIKLMLQSAAQGHEPALSFLNKKNENAVSADS